MFQNPKSLSEPFAGPKLKFMRAKAHYENLKAVFEAYVATNPYGGFVDIDEKTRQKHYKIRIHKPMPIGVPVILGDVLQNLRAALEHAACCLAIQKNPAVNINDVGFPICRDVNEFKSKARNSIKKLSPEARTFIEDMKPYGGGEERFWLLHRLAIKDRHRLTLPVWIGGGPVGIKPVMHHPTTGEKIEFQSIFLNPADKYSPLEDGAVVLTAPIEKAGIDDQIQVALEIAIGDGELFAPRPLVPLLDSLGELVLEKLVAIEKKFFS